MKEEAFTNGNVQRAGCRPLVCSITGTPDAAYCTSTRFVQKTRMSEARRRIPRSAALLGRESTCALPDSSSLGILLWRLCLHVAVFVSAFAYQAIQSRSIAQLLAQDKVPARINHELQPPCPTRKRHDPLSRHVNEEWHGPFIGKPTRSPFQSSTPRSICRKRTENMSYSYLVIQHNI